MILYHILGKFLILSSFYLKFVAKINFFSKHFVFSLSQEDSFNLFVRILALQLSGLEEQERQQSWKQLQGRLVSSPNNLKNEEFARFCLTP